MLPDLRWQQRLSNFRRALQTLQKGVDLAGVRPLSELEEQGLIQAFEFTHELAWNVMKDWFEYQGNTSIGGSREATREAFQRGLVADGQIWIEMILSRNLSSHTYNLETARKIATAICEKYVSAFGEFLTTMEQKATSDGL